MDHAHFVVVSGSDKDKKLEVKEGGPHLMGRHQDAVYRVDDPRCSRFHCQIFFENGKVTVVDQGGSGGTLVNGLKVERHTLKHGDTFQIGDTKLQFKDGQQGEAETVHGVGAADYDPKATEQLSTLTGRMLTRYKVGGVIGKGVSSMVFKAIDTDDDKTVALKVMQPAFSQDEEEMQRFLRAMKSTMPLKHPNLITMYNAGKSGPYCWAAMEYVEGESLTEVINRIGVAGMLDWRMAFRVAVHVGRALEYAHGQGIIHRNVAPPNILWDASDKRAMLGDLMLAKALEGVLARQITAPGEIVGDVQYMSPERTTGDAGAVDHRSDLFSLGATVYALLAGKSPFAGRNLVECVRNVRQVEPVKPSNFQIGIASAFEGAVLKLLAKTPSERYQSATELLNDLDRIGRLNGVQV